MADVRKRQRKFDDEPALESNPVGHRVSECESEGEGGGDLSEYESAAEEDKSPVKVPAKRDLNAPDDEEDEEEDEEEDDEDEDDDDDEDDDEDDDDDDDEEEDEEEGTEINSEFLDEDSLFEERQMGDGEEQPAEKELDDDEDRKNPAFVPRKGMFYEHDNRLAEVENKEEPKPKKPLWKDDGKWVHDRFSKDLQAPKSREELIAEYGYDIRLENHPPPAPKPGMRRGRGRRQNNSKLGDYMRGGGTNRHHQVRQMNEKNSWSSSPRTPDFPDLEYSREISRPKKEPTPPRRESEDVMNHNRRDGGNYSRSNGGTPRDRPDFSRRDSAETPGRREGRGGSRGGGQQAERPREAGRREVGARRGDAVDFSRQELLELSRVEPEIENLQGEIHTVITTGGGPSSPPTRVRGRGRGRGVSRGAGREVRRSYSDFAGVDEGQRRDEGPAGDRIQGGNRKYSAMRPQASQQRREFPETSFHGNSEKRSPEPAASRGGRSRRGPASPPPRFQQHHQQGTTARAEVEDERGGEVTTRTSASDLVISNTADVQTIQLTITTEKGFGRQERTVSAGGEGDGGYDSRNRQPKERSDSKGGDGRGKGENWRGGPGRGEATQGPRQSKRYSAQRQRAAADSFPEQAPLSESQQYYNPAFAGQPGYYPESSQTTEASYQPPVSHPLPLCPCLPPCLPPPPPVSHPPPSMGTPPHQPPPPHHTPPRQPPPLIHSQIIPIPASQAGLASGPPPPRLYGAPVSIATAPLLPPQYLPAPPPPQA